MKKVINKITEKIEWFMEFGGIKKEIALLCIAGGFPCFKLAQ